MSRLQMIGEIYNKVLGRTCIYRTRVASFGSINKSELLDSLEQSVEMEEHSSMMDGRTTPSSQSRYGNTRVIIVELEVHQSIPIVEKNRSPLSIGPLNTSAIDRLRKEYPVKPEDCINKKLLLLN